MPYKGHVENGVIVIDEPAPIREGLEVRIEIVPPLECQGDPAPLRGTPYRFERPLDPAVAETAWESSR